VGQRVADAALQQFGRIDILVNNAGVAGGARVETLSEETWDANHDINLKGTFLMCQAVIPAMKKQNAGRIMNASSFAAIIPSIGSAALVTRWKLCMLMLNVCSHCSSLMSSGRSTGFW